MLKIAICDDDFHVVASLESIISNYEKRNNEKFEIISFYSGDTLYECIDNGTRFDIIFLDIELPHIDGLSIGNYVRKVLHDDIVQIIYISSHKNYALSLFKIRPMDFLIKPIIADEVNALLAVTISLSNSSKKYYSYKIGRDYFKIPLKDIIYFKSSNREVQLVCAQKSVNFYSSLGAIYEELQDYGFIRCHRSYLVNYQHINNFEYHKLTLSNGAIIPIGQGNRKTVRKVQLDMEFERGTL